MSDIEHSSVAELNSYRLKRLLGFYRLFDVIRIHDCWPVRRFEECVLSSKLSIVRRRLQDNASESALVHRHELSLGRAGVNLPRPANLRRGAGVHFHPMRDPSW